MASYLSNNNLKILPEQRSNKAFIECKLTSNIFPYATGVQSGLRINNRWQVYNIEKLIAGVAKLEGSTADLHPLTESNVTGQSRKTGSSASGICSVSKWSSNYVLFNATTIYIIRFFRENQKQSNLTFICARKWWASTNIAQCRKNVMQIDIFACKLSKRSFLLCRKKTEDKYKLVFELIKFLVVETRDS